MRLRAVSMGLLVTALGGCLAGTWGRPAALVSEQQVAAALGEAADSDEPFDPRTLVRINAPERVRPCCAFGMDLQVQVAGVAVPGYSVGNIIDAGDLGRHEYDNGALTLNQDLARFATLEKNGLVYTCRGGFIDTAHVRDNADLTLFLAMRIVAAMPRPAVITLEGDRTIRRVMLGEVPEELTDRFGRWEVAITLAQWASFQLSIWHEIATWYGVESVPGFSEKVSAFSPEDLYSNVLGALIAGGILRNRKVYVRAEWNVLVEAWMPAALRRLGALSPDLGRRAMKALDGRWWDSKKQLPDWTLVRRRKMDIGLQVTPWRVQDAQAPEDSVLEAACAESPALLRLAIPERVGDRKVSDLVKVDFEVDDWAPASWPFPDKKARRVTSAEIPIIVAMVHDAAQEALGPGFDEPGPLPPSVAPPPGSASAAASSAPAPPSPPTASPAPAGSAD